MKEEIENDIKLMLEFYLEDGIIVEDNFESIVNDVIQLMKDYKSEIKQL